MPRLEGGVGRRRNGKQQACEVCRKLKLACDHGSPFCGRCTRRKITGKCIYHPAPMTRATTSNALPSPQQTASSTSNQTSGQDRHSSTPGVSEGQNPQNGFDMAPPLAYGEYAGQIGWRNTIYRRSSRYCGPTSVLAVFSEHQAEDLLDIGEDGRKHPGTWPCGQPLLGKNREGSPTVRTEMVIKALRNIPTRRICESLLEKHDTPFGVTQSVVMVKHCIVTLWSTLGESLEPPRTVEKLSTIAEILFKNEEFPLPPAPDDGMEWLDTFMGLNMRFEMMGMFFCFLGIAYLSLQDWDEVFHMPENLGRDRKETVWRMKECTDVCLKMCESTETVNEIVVALMLNVCVLESGCIGDEHYQLRRRHGDMTVTAVAAGLHRLPDFGANGINKVTAASEYRRRIWGAAYHLDKTHSSLNGIPPGLSRFYSTLRLPLDLSDEVLFGTQDDLNLAISKLDSNGWNTSGQWYSVTRHRAMQLLSQLREEILELSLGVNLNVTAAQIDDLHQRCRLILAGLPEQLRYYAPEGAPKDSTGILLVLQANLALEFLQCRFLIDRMAVARGFANGQGLLDTAIEMMDLTVMFWIKRDQLMMYTSKFDWFITWYGVPSAGVICVELLKQNCRPPQSSVHFSRSDAVQKLTMFIGFLEWIRPTDGNFLLAGRLRKVVRRILDHVLEPPQEANGHDNMIGGPLDAPMDDMDGLDWLNSVDWTQGPWMEFN